MAIDTAGVTTLVTPSENLDTKAFSVQTDAAMFTVLMKRIYSKLLAAPIRELSTNAIDACIEADKPIKFDVHLPTITEVHFGVRDYGNGIPPEFMDTAYTVVGASTKRGSNTTNGQFGMGRLSPLAYTTDYIVETYINGVQRTYMVFLQNGIPTLTKLLEKPTTEANGTLVKFAVENDDIGRVTNIALGQFMFFSHKPTLNIECTYPTPLVDNETYAFCTNGISNSILMGNVLYPIQTKCYIPTSEGLIIKAPIGAVSVTPGREQISTDQKSAQFIRDAITSVSARLNSDVANALVSLAPRKLNTTFVKVKNAINSIGTLAECYNQLKQQSNELYSITMNSHDLIVTFTTPNVLIRTKMRWRNSFPKTSYIYLNEMYSNPICLVDNINGVTRAKAYLTDRGSASGAIVSTGSRFKSDCPNTPLMKKTLESLDIPYVTTSSMADESFPKKTKDLKPKSIRALAINSNTMVSLTDQADTTRHYLQIPFEAYLQTDKNSISTLLQELTPYRQYYLLSKTHLAKARKNPQWVDATEEVSKLLRENPVIVNDVRASYDIIAVSNLYRNNPAIFPTTVKKLLDQPEIFWRNRLPQDEAEHLIACIGKYLPITICSVLPEYRLARIKEKLPLYDNVTAENLAYYVKLEALKEKHEIAGND